MMDLNWKGVRKQNKVHSNFEAHTILYKSGIMLIIVIFVILFEEVITEKRSMCIFVNTYTTRNSEWRDCYPFIWGLPSFPC